MSDLRHEFVLCDFQECGDKQPHCRYVWCGAPKDHPLHLNPESPEEYTDEKLKGLWLKPENLEVEE